LVFRFHVCPSFEFYGAVSSEGPLKPWHALSLTPESAWTMGVRKREKDTRNFVRHSRLPCIGQWERERECPEVFYRQLATGSSVVRVIYNDKRCLGSR
jgi:hypothetical protein